MNIDLKEPSEESKFVLNPIALSFLKNFRKILIINLLAAIFSVVFSLSLNNIYESEVKIILKQEIQSPSSGLGMVLPINIGASSGYEINLIRSVLNSRDFFKILYSDDEFILKTEAIHNYDKNSNTLKYDSSMVDNENNWIIEKGSSAKPSFEDAYKNFRGYFTSSVEQSSGIVTLSLKHISPFESKQLLDKTYLYLNEYLKNLKLEEINKKINFLNISYYESTIQEIKTNISSVLQNEIEKRAIFLSSENIYFDLIDSPSKGIRVEPKRSLLVIFFCVITFSFSLIFFVARDMYARIK